MFSRRFSEGQTLANEGAVRISLPEDDPDAMVILMHLIHANLSRVPCPLSKTQLIGMASCIDKYDIQGISGPCFRPFLYVLVNAKFDKVESSLEIGSVAYVFKEAGVFKKATRFAVINGDGHNQDNYCSIPSFILGK